MTLATPRINEFAERLYLRFIKNETLSADACSDMYDQFIKQMNKFRRRHPDKVRVSTAFVRRCEDWIIKNVMLSEKRKKSRWELECELAKTRTGETQAQDNYSAAFALLKLGKCLSHWLEREPKAAPFLEIFLLHHAYYLNGRILNQFSKILPLRKSEFVRRVKKVKKTVAQRFAQKVSRAMDASGIWYCRSLKADMRARDASPDKRAEHEAKRDECLMRQRRALKRSTAVKPHPKYTELAEICGLSERQVRYALKKCQGKVAEMAGME